MYATILLAAILAVSSFNKGNSGKIGLGELLNQEHYGQRNKRSNPF